jgi:hypothetical protein
MAKYRITGPFGETFEVTAPDGASEQDVISFVRKNGVQSDFAQRAAAMTPDELSAVRSSAGSYPFGDYLRNEAKRPRDGESEDARLKRLYGGISSPDVGAGEGVARAALQAFGGGDELVAAGAAAVNKLTGKDADRSYGELYDAYRDRERGKIGQFREEHPVAAYGAEIAGALTTGVGLAGAGAKIARMFPAATSLLPGVSAAPSAFGTAVRGAATAGSQGGLYGYLAGEGGVGERAKNAALGAAVALPIGAAAPVVGAGVRNLARRLMTSGAASRAGMSRPSYDVLTRAMDSDGSLTGTGAANIQRGGPGAMVADAGPNARTLLDTAIQRSGPAGNAAREAIEARASGANTSMTGALDASLGAPAGVRSTARGIAQSTAAAREAAYKRAYAAPIDYASAAGRRVEAALERVPNRTLNSAVSTANDMMQADGVRNMQIMAQIAPDGAVTFKEMPNVQQLDYIKRALNELGSATDDLGRPTGESMRAAKVARMVRDATTDAVPEYGAAVKLGGDKIERDNALRLGYSLLRDGTTREVVKEGAANLSDEAAEALRLGVRSYIDDTLANVKGALTDPNMDAREAVKAIKSLSSRASHEKLATVLGDQEAEQLLKQIDMASAALELRASVAANSKTFARTAMDEVIQAQTDDGVVNAFRSGKPLETGKRVAQTLMSRTPADKERIADTVYGEIVKFLTGPRGPDAAAAVQGLTASQQGIQAGTQRARNLAESLMRGNAAITAPTYNNLR